MRICDTHQHLWDLDRFNLPWTASVAVLNRSFLSTDYLAAVADCGVEKTVYMEVDLAPQQRLAEVEFVAEVCEDKTTPTVAAVVAGEPGADGFEDYLATVQTNPHVRGLRRILHVDETAPGHCLQPRFIADIEKLAEPGLSFDICIRADELSDAATLIRSCPDVQFILDHCGNADLHADADAKARWRDGISTVAAQPNVLCKVSGFIWTVRDQPWQLQDLSPVVDHVYQSFGPQRLMFGGDWPVCTQSVSLAAWINALREIVADWPAAEQQALFYDNAARFYRLDD